MAVIKYTYTGVSVDKNKSRIISPKTEKKIFKFHWYVEYMLIGMAALIAIVHTTEMFFSELPEYIFSINVDFLTAFTGVVIGLFLARIHAKKIHNNV